MITTGISIDAYLSPRVMSHALQLAAAVAKPVILCGQSLFLGDTADHAHRWLRDRGGVVA